MDGMDTKLKREAQQFLVRYPEGFESEALKKLSSKHKMPQLIALAQSTLSDATVKVPESALKAAKDLIAKSTMVSLFEKPKFRDAVNSFSHEEAQRFTLGLRELLYGDEGFGFELLVGVLAPYGIAKWPIITAFRCYVFPNTDLLIKPTTVKNAIAFFEWRDLAYTTRPNYEFYHQYRQRVIESASQVSPLLSPTLAHFSGFMMMVMDTN